MLRDIAIANIALSVLLFVWALIDANRRLLRTAYTINWMLISKGIKERM